jgi:hypothetical protein
MEGIEAEPTRTTKIRRELFRLFARRRQFKKHLDILENTTTKHPKVFNLIRKENLLELCEIEYDLRKTIHILKSL